MNKLSIIKKAICELIDECNTENLQYIYFDMLEDIKFDFEGEH